MASVKKAWIRKYGEKEGLKRWEKQKKKYGRTKKQLIESYGVEKYNEMLNFLKEREEKK